MKRLILSIFLLISLTQINCKTRKRLLKIFMLLAICILFNSNLKANYIYPIFPNGDTNVSTAARILFQTQYPVNMDLLRPTSPISLDNNGNLLSAHYLVVPTEYLDDPLRVFYSVECELYLSEQNLITILPYKPFNYNTQYSVVFSDFPLMVPDINNSNGYYDHPESLVFENYFTTISPPLNFEISFEKTHSLIWCDKDISIRFNNPIFPNDATLSEMFSIIESETGAVISVDVLLSQDGMTANLTPNSNLDAGAYFLKMNMAGYTGDERFDDSYRFVVTDKMVIVFKSNIDPYYRNSQYGYYSTFKYGDTAYFNTKRFLNDENNVFENWDLPGEDGVNYTVDSNGMLKIIFDCDNYFYNNSLAEQQITITANYMTNPIDTLIITFDTLSLSQVCDSTFHLHYKLTNSLTTTVVPTTYIVEGTQDQPGYVKTYNNSIHYTYHRYSYNTMVLHNYTIFDITDTCIIGIGTASGDGFFDENIEDIEIERSVAPYADNLMMNGHEVNVINGKYGLDIQLEKTNGCCVPGMPTGIHNFNLYINFVGESPIIFDFMNDGLINDASLMFSVLDFRGNCLNSAVGKNLFRNIANYKEFGVKIENVGTCETSIPYNIEIAPQYRNLYEIYNVYADGSSTAKSCYENIDNSSFNASGQLGINRQCGRNLYVQIRRKIVALDIFVHNVDPQVSVPTHKQANLYFMNGDNQKALNLTPKDVEILSNGSVENSIYGKKYGPVHTDIVKFGDIVNIITETQTTYYFYAGTTINADPFIEDDIGYYFDHWGPEPEGAIFTDLEEKGIELFFDGTQKVKTGDIFLSTGFRLEYIGVMKEGTAGTISGFKYYKVDNASNGIETATDIWENNQDNYDEGVAMNREMTGNNDLHKFTTALRFVFNKEYNAKTLEENIKICDVGKHSPELGANNQLAYLRDDGKECVNEYIWIPFKTGVQGATTISGLYTNGLPYWEVELKQPYKICHLQPFNININNYNGCIKSEQDEELSNISKIEQDGANFRSCTFPPGIKIDVERFHNYTHEDTYGGNIEAIITGFSISDKGELTVADVNSFAKVDPNDGRVEYRIVAPMRFPTAYYEELGTNNSFYVNTRVEAITRLFYKQRFMLNFHWIDDDKKKLWFLGGDCNDVVDLVYNSELAKKIFTLIGEPEIGEAASAVIESIGKIVKGLLCDGKNKYLDHNDFWLDYKGNLNKKADADGKPISWDLWGVGKYNMYTEQKRYAYGTFFRIGDFNNITGRYEVKPDAGSSTRIQIGVGDY